METRKLQKVGGGTYTVSIPKEWATAHALEAGTPVHLYTHMDGSVVIRSSEKDGGNLAGARVEVHREGPAAVRRALQAAQAIGFESVTLARDGSFSAAERRAVRATVRDYVGTEVVEEADDAVTVRNLLDASEVSVRQWLVQLRFVALSIHRQASAALVDGGDVHDRLRERHAEASRLFAMISRHFNRALVSFEEVDRLGLSRVELFDYHVTARQLERVADRGVAIARVAEALSDPLSGATGEEVGRLAESAGDVVDDATTAVLDGGEVEAAQAALDRCEETIAAVEAAEEALVGEPSAEAVPTARALDGVARTADRGGRVAEVAIRAATRAECL
jgi:phosphate uptake regulator